MTQQHTTTAIDNCDYVGSKHSSDPNQLSPKVCLSWEKLTVTCTPPTSSCKSSSKSHYEGAEPLPHTILNDVTGIVKPGQFMAILGSSGAGKTTLLNTLACRVPAKLSVSGSVRVNGQAVTMDKVKKICGYVEHNTMFIGAMTVREVAMFYANLRLDSRIPAATKKRMVQSVLQNVGLTGIQNNLVGDEDIHGISGGERKRLSVATQLLLGASLLFLDEVTSGLDSFMAENILKLIRQLAKSGCTILCTIHQPASELYAMFDRVCLVAEGSIVFMGTPPDALEHFERAGFPCPPHFCPADHFIYTLAIRPDQEDGCRDRCDVLTHFYKCSKFFKDTMDEIEAVNSMICGSLKSHLKEVTRTSSCWKQFSENFTRSFYVCSRNPRYTRARIITNIILAILIGTFYWNTKNDIETVKANKCGVIFVYIITSAFRSLNFSTLSIPLAYPIIRREYRNGLYATLPYFLSLVVCELPYLIGIPLLQLCLSYFAVGLRRDLVSFANAVACNIVTSWTATGLGWCIGAAAAEPKMAAQIALTITMPFFFFSGLVKSEQDTPSYLLPVKYTSFLRYGFNMMMVNEFKDLELDCAGTANSCPNGTSILIDMGIDPNELWWPNMAANFIIGACCSVAAWLCLCYRAPQF